MLFDVLGGDVVARRWAPARHHGERGRSLLDFEEAARASGLPRWELVTRWLDAWRDACTPAELGAALSELPALTVRQPWASLIASGQKRVEVRSWRTDYRGPVLIVAGTRQAPGMGEISEAVARLPRGVAVALADLADVREMTVDDCLAALAFGGVPDGTPRAWVLGEVLRVPPFPVRGRLGLHRVELAKGTPPDAAADPRTAADLIRELANRGGWGEAEQEQQYLRLGSERAIALMNAGNPYPIGEFMSDATIHPLPWLEVKGQGVRP